MLTLHKNNVSCMNSIRINRADIWKLIAMGTCIILCEICIAAQKLDKVPTDHPEGDMNVRNKFMSSDCAKKQKCEPHGESHLFDLLFGACCRADVKTFNITCFHTRVERIIFRAASALIPNF